MTLELLDRLLGRRGGVAAALGLLAGLFLLSADGGETLDRMLRVARDSVRSHEASGEVQIVEIDSRSLREIAHWPWPRRYHGALIDRLHAAGVRSIGFDVDFSSRSNPADDAAMAAALRRAEGGVALAALLQHESAGSPRIVENVPIPEFRDNAFLAAVNVAPDRDGQIREMPLGLVIDGAPRPSLAALAAERDAEAGRSFAIDYAIDPATIPRHSYADVIAGRVPASALRGKRILIGATAIENGDRYAVPGHGVLPGVVIQAIAAETLLAGPLPSKAGGGWPLLIAALVMLLTLRPGRPWRRGLGFGFGVLIVLAIPLAGEQWFALTLPIAPALLALAVGGPASLGLHAANRFRERSLFDGPTGLPNIASLERDAPAQGATLVVARIDRFAAIAAGIGPAATINLVHRVADRLRFGRDCVIYRLDEANLAWLEPSGDDAPELEEQLEGLGALMRTPIDCGRPIDVKLGLGLARPVAAGIGQQAADAALAAERAAGSGKSWQWFEAGSEETDWHLSLFAELDAAMAAGQLWNAYQPKLDLASGRILGAEALVRWDHPTRGPIPPDRFIPLVEAQGRARDLTLHVLSRALDDAAAWRAQGLELGVAVNISATLLLDASFVVLLEREIAAARVPVEWVTLEVTESAAMRDSGAAVAALQSWRALGLHISIDDYGTGQSSLAYLQTLPATELKIDKSFVVDMVCEARNAIMVRSTVAMAHELGMKVVAEGVEDEACLALLAEIGCDVAQGWHIGKPMSALEMARLVAERDRAAA